MDSYLSENKWHIYRHTSPSGKIYIGITKQSVISRWKNGEGYKPCLLFYRAVLKYGWNSIKHEILFSDLTFEKATQLEKDLIRHYKSLGISYNITDGGEGCLGRKCNENTKAKLSLINKGKINPNKGKKIGNLPQEWRDNISKGHLGLRYNRTSEWKDKISKIMRLKCKPVLQLDKDTSEIIKEFPSASEAAKSLNISRGNIVNCCLKKPHVKTVGGYVWRYKE